MVRLNNKTIIYITYSCSVCGQQYGTAAGVNNHTLSKHGLHLPSRKVGIKRPQNEDYDYMIDVNRTWHHQHHGCSSCWFHSGNYEKFQKHVETQHLRGKQQNSKMAQKPTKNRVMINEGNQEEEEIMDSGRYDLGMARTVNKQIGELHTMFRDLLRM